MAYLRLPLGGQYSVMAYLGLLLEGQYRVMNKFLLTACIIISHFQLISKNIGNFF